MKKNVKNCGMENNVNEELEKEFAMINLAVQMRILTYDTYVKELERISKKYDLPMIVRNKNLDNGEVTIKVIC